MNRTTVFLIELGKEKADLATLDKADLGNLTFSIFDAEAIILFDGSYCCEKDPGAILLRELIRQHPDKTFYIVKGNGLHETFKQNSNIIYSRELTDIKKATA